MQYRCITKSAGQSARHWAKACSNSLLPSSPSLGRTTHGGCRLDVHENRPLRRDLLDVVPIQPDVVSSRKKSRESVRSVRVRAPALEFHRRTDDAIDDPGHRAMPLVEWGNGGLRLRWRVNNEQSRDDGEDDSQRSRSTPPRAPRSRTTAR